jgi:ubiquinone/menaquinone biosynthesis C-methylase UbiE
MVGIARSTHPEVVVTEGDAEDLPYPDSAFHAVVSSFGIHHVPRPELALAECWRVLKPGARIAFTVELCRNLGDDGLREAAYRGGCRACQNLSRRAIRHERDYQHPALSSAVCG